MNTYKIFTTAQATEIQADQVATSGNFIYFQLRQDQGVGTGYINVFVASVYGFISYELLAGE